MGRLFTIEEYVEYRSERFNSAVKMLTAYCCSVYPTQSGHETSALYMVNSMMPVLVAEDDDPMFWKHALGLHGRVGNRPSEKHAAGLCKFWKESPVIIGDSGFEGRCFETGELSWICWNIR